MKMCRTKLSQQATPKQAPQQQTSLPVTLLTTMQWAWPMELLLLPSRRRKQTAACNPRTVNYSGITMNTG